MTKNQRIDIHKYLVILNLVPIKCYFYADFKSCATALTFDHEIILLSLILVSLSFLQNRT